MHAMYGNLPTLEVGTAIFHSDGTVGWYGSGIGAGTWHKTGTRRYIFTFVNISAAGRGAFLLHRWLERLAPPQTGSTPAAPAP